MKLMILIIALVFVQNSFASQSYATDCKSYNNCKIEVVSNTVAECLDEQIQLIEENEESYSAAEIEQQHKDAVTMCKSGN